MTWGRVKPDEAVKRPGVWSAWPRARWTTQEARVSRRVGAANRIVLDSSADDAVLEILPPMTEGSPGTRLIVQTREGELMLDADGIALLCLLAMVPFPAGGDRDKARLRASLAVTRLPPPLAGLQWSIGRFVETAERDRSPSSASRKTSLFAQRLHARREDVSLYCNAWATGSVWEAILEHGLAMAGSGEAARRVEDLPVRFSFELARVLTASRQVSALGVGDVVRMPMWLDVQGHGAIGIAGWRVVLSAEPGTGLRRFTVLSVHRESRSDPGASPVFFLHASQRRSLHTDMQSPLPPTAVPAMPMASGTHPPAGLPDDSASPSNGALDALPIVLAAELGTLTLSVGSLRNLAPGMVLEIEAVGSHEVTLRAIDGQIFAAGRIVDVDGHPGIQITQVGGA